MSLKKPLCIDSTVVQKIDRVSQAKAVSSAYACNVDRQVPYSVELDTIINKVSANSEKVVFLLNSIKPFKNKLTLRLHEDRPLMYSIDKNQIDIGTQFAQSANHLSRAIIKSWILENKNNSKINTDLFNESMTDLILFIATGKIEIEDPTDKVRTKLGSVKWPQVIKTNNSYCASAWKLSEHAESCFNQKRVTSLLQDSQDELAAFYSLRPLLTSALINSYAEMDFKSRQMLVQKLAMLINSIYLPADKAIESMLTDTNPIHNGIININKFTDLILSSTVKSRSEIYQFYTGINQQLQQLGVTESFAEAYFDYIIEYDGEINQQSTFYKLLNSAAAKNSNVQIALKDSKNVWILPSIVALPLKVFNKIRSKQTLLIGCKKNNNIQVSHFFQKTEKLMLINECHQNLSYDFNALFEKGITNFISKNHQFSFVQLHIPSIEMIKEQLANDLKITENYFELVKNRDVNKKEFKTFGWTQVQWNKDLQAYRPKAVVDAIEYFRN